MSWQLDAAHDGVGRHGRHSTRAHAGDRIDSCWTTYPEQSLVVAAHGHRPGSGGPGPAASRRR